MQTVADAIQTQVESTQQPQSKRGEKTLQAIHDLAYMGESC